MNYEIDQHLLSARGVPFFRPDGNFSSRELKIRGFTTFACSPVQSLSRAEERLRAVQQQVKRGRHQELVHLLDEHPEFIAKSWVRGALVKWLETGRSYRQRGRPKGSLCNPLITAGVVTELIGSKSGITKAEAFQWVADHLHMSCDTVRDQYYNARNQERFRPLLISTDDRETPISLHENDDAELVTSGKSITRTLAQSEEGPMTITFHGLDQKPGRSSSSGDNAYVVTGCYVRPNVDLRPIGQR